MSALIGFMESAPRNAWICSGLGQEVYVRKGPRMIDGKKYNRVLDIANVTTREKKQNKGMFKRFLLEAFARLRPNIVISRSPSLPLAGPCWSSSSTMKQPLTRLKSSAWFRLLIAPQRCSSENNHGSISGFRDVVRAALSYWGSRGMFAGYALQSSEARGSRI